MKLVWCPDTASKAYIDGVRAIADHSSDSDGGSSSPELAELVAAMAGGWNAQLIVDAPAAPTSSSSTTSLALAAAVRRTGGRYALLDDPHAADDADAPPDQYSSAAMSNLQGVDLLVLDMRRRDAAAVLRSARPGPRGMVVVRHGDTVGGGGGGGGILRRRGAAATAEQQQQQQQQQPPWGAMMAAGTRVVRAASLPIGGAGGVQVLHVGVGKGPSLPLPRTTTQHGGRRSSAGGGGAGRGRWIRHVNHRTGEEHVFRRQ